MHVIKNWGGAARAGTPRRSTTLTLRSVMEACLAVEREQEKVIKKLKTVSGSASKKLQRILDQIQALKEQLARGRSTALVVAEP